MSFNPHQWYLNGLSQGDVADYSEAAQIYSLKKIIPSWNIAPIQLRRSSDNNLKYVFFDTNGELSLSSFVADGSETPTATTLATWIGSDDAYIQTWLPQNPTGAIVSNDIMQQLGSSNQPKFITAGIIETKNGNPTILFDGINDLLRLNFASGLSSINGDFSIFTTSHQDTALGTELGCLLHTSDTSLTTGLAVWQDNRIEKRASTLYATGGTVSVDMDIQINTTNQKLVSVIKNATEITGYGNGNIGSTLLWSGTYVNDDLFFGARDRVGNFFKGGVQEIIIFPSDVTTDAGIIHTDIINRWNIP